MIELITNGALPKPGKCVACGYSGNDRYYFRFQAFIPGTRGAQILLCTAKGNSSDLTGCMDEAARRFPVGFMTRAEGLQLSNDNLSLKAENDRLGIATNEFTDGFAHLVSAFLSSLSGSAPAPTDSGITASKPARITNDGVPNLIS